MPNSKAGDRPPRLLADVPLPPYRYVPGQAPHPFSDPAGHRYQPLELAAIVLQVDHWHDCEPYLLGCDLFNAGFCWEAHETWESIWHVLGRKGLTADMLKGLIKLAAAGVKILEPSELGVTRHARRAAELFRSVEVQSRLKHAQPKPDSDAAVYLGLDLPALQQLGEQMALQAQQLIQLGLPLDRDASHPVSRLWPSHDPRLRQPAGLQ